MNKKSPIRFLVKYTKKYWLKLFLAVVFMVSSSILNVLPPYLFKSVVDDVLISKNMLMLNVICLSLILIFGLKAVTTYFQHYFMNEAGQSVVMDIRIDLYDHMQRMSLKRIYASRIGELMSRITGDAAVLQNVVTSTFIDLMFNFITFLGMFTFILYINWKLTCLIILVLPIIGYMLSFASKKYCLKSLTEFSKPPKFLIICLIYILVNKLFFCSKSDSINCFSFIIISFTTDLIKL